MLSPIFKLLLKPKERTATTFLFCYSSCYQRAFSSLSFTVKPLGTVRVGRLAKRHHTQTCLFASAKALKLIGSFPVTSFTAVFSLCSFPLLTTSTSNPARKSATSAGILWHWYHLLNSSPDSFRCSIGFPRISVRVFATCKDSLMYLFQSGMNNVYLTSSYESSSGPRTT